MAEVLLGSFLQVLFDRLASRELLNYARREKLRSRLKRWERNLQDINIVLEDAEDRAMGGESRVITPWLDDLRDLAYEVDDLLDEFGTEEALRSSFMPSDQAGASSSKLYSLLLPRCITCNLSPRRLVFKHEMGSKVKEIDGRLADIKSRKETLRLSEGGGGRIYIASHQRRLPSTYLAEPFILGRDNDREAIMNFLMDENEDLSVIPIVGMGGLGKTTLARLVYNDEKVKGSFPVRAWACVSDEFDVLAVMRTIFLQIMGRAHEGKDLNVLQVEIQNSLSVSGKKFLIVLDDVWDKEDATLHDRWTLLRRKFESGRAKVYTLGTLSPDDCKALLAYHALGVVNFDNHPDIKPAGEKIAAKCAGLPLAAKTVGGVLRSRYELGEWKTIAQSRIWDLPETKGVPQALLLSYIYLPSDLKRCFVYCAVFPKDHEFDKDDLISLWMAEGLLGRARLEESMRDLGLRYFRELLSRSFFHPFSGQESSFVMHDLLSDLAASIAGEFCLSLGEGQLDSCKEKKSLEKVRHLSLNPHHYEVSGRRATKRHAKLSQSGEYLGLLEGQAITTAGGGMMTCSLNFDDGSNRSSGSGGNCSAMRPPSQLQELSIPICPALMPFDFLNDNAKQLVVSSPKKLDIYRSEVLGSSLEGTTTMGLEEIAIACCKMLNSLSPHLHRSFTRLTQLHLKDCPALELRVLAVASRHPVSSSYSWLPRDQVSLTADACSLVPARTRDCTGIASFPEEGLPPNQAHLNVWECENLNRPMSKWGLKETTAFRGLTIGGKIGCLVGTNSFPPPPDHEEEDEGRGQGKGGWHVLPPSMISRCKATSLLKLKFLPREGFLASLGLLHIGGCSEDLVGDYFPIIERIPDICL
ncbi:hypothetical protein CDL15_Pgr016603 [Punica granatum]|uniref:Disease resistance RPP13-like protein 1 n=1 Tax=Punica granatum TaxID=22663 RepID=A0A218XT78_PUNGR|nr:hypothetical protein CDL15_Pgr016603 [Punica granatum]